MDNLKYFQRYHGKENTHSSNALSLLHMLYDYSPKKFYSTLGALIESQGPETHPITSSCPCFDERVLYRLDVPV